jgi:dihydrofolate reductase
MAEPSTVARRCRIGTVFGGMAASLDGFIQSTSGDLSWLNDAMAPDEDYGFTETEQRTGAYIVGANTYREMRGMSFGKVPTYVVTHEPASAPETKAHTFSGDLRQLVAQIKTDTDKDICVFGGGDLVTQFLELDLLDELGVSVIPVLLGDGVPFFGRLSDRHKLELLTCEQFPSGIVLLNYRVTAPTPRKRRS